MKCPICAVDLVMSERHAVEIDYCPQCRGVWLDRGELDKIIDKATGPMVQPEPAPPPRVEPAPEPRLWQEPYREQPAPPERHPRRDDDDRYHERDRYRDDRSYKKRKRKSFLEEIFDFD